VFRAKLIRRARAHGLQILIAATFVGVGVSASGCEAGGSKSWAKGPRGEGKAEALQVATTQLSPADIERHYRTSGTLTAMREAQIVATEMGVIRAVAAEEGDEIKKGDTLARLDGRELALQASQAKLQLKNLERELQRLESVKGGAISAEEIDKQRYLVQEARVTAELSNVQAKQTVVRAPFNGTLVERHSAVSDRRPERARAGAVPPGKGRRNGQARCRGAHRARRRQHLRGVDHPPRPGGRSADRDRQVHGPRQRVSARRQAGRLRPGTGFGGRA
jgi:multidrug efflux pump subunit AcrA (membrane-fusion protein)